MTTQRLLGSLLVLLASASSASAQTALSCPTTSSTTGFTGSGLQQDCSACVSSPCTCTTKSGVTYDTTNNVLTLPGAAGNFQAPPGAAINVAVYFAAAADFDKDGWDDFVAADDVDEIFVMRNQTVTCGKTSCVYDGAPTGANILLSNDAWWNTLTNVRQAFFATTTTAAGVQTPLKASVADAKTPMVAADFDGDGWPDFVEVSAEGMSGSYWPTAARIYLNSHNCLSAAHAPVNATTAALAIAVTSSGLAPAGGGTTTASANTYAASLCPAGDTQTTVTATANYSCTNATGTTCPSYMPTFASFDARTGAFVSSTGTTSTTATTTTYPGDFGPLPHSASNIIALDFDGDGDIDILYGHGSGSCPSGGAAGKLCTVNGQTFAVGVDIWLNDCAQSSKWVAATKSCAGHVPTFTKATHALIPDSSNTYNTAYTSLPNGGTGSEPLGFDDASSDGPSFTYADIDNDGDLDLVIGAPGCCSGSANAGNRLRIYKGTTGSKYSHKLDTANPIVLSTTQGPSGTSGTCGTNAGSHPGFEGSLAGMFVYDFNGDGYPDLVTGSDGGSYCSYAGGRTRYWKNTGNATAPFGSVGASAATRWPTCSAAPASCTGCSATCNPDPTTKISETSPLGQSDIAYPAHTPEPEFPDFDIGLMLNYDNDPNSTKDFIFTNGNGAAAQQFFIFPNRASPNTFAACGAVASGTLATPAAELTVSGACITPSASVPSGTAIQYSLSNDGGSTWTCACTQISTGIYSDCVDNPPVGAQVTGGQCCANFTNTTNRQIEWQAELDSNTSDGIGPPSGCGVNGTAVPTLTSVSADYVYTQDQQHYQAGVIVSDGVSYVGSFTEPGDRGHLYAIAENFSTQYYDVGAKIDAQGSRTVYTSGSSSPWTRAAFTGGTAAGALTGAGVSWVLTPRFGVNSSGIALTNLGAIVDSTPAILQVPFKPNWYSFLDTTGRTLYDNFATAQAQRIPLLMFGSMDGMVHAIYTIATSIADTRNGQEAWAFVPPDILTGMQTDYTTSCSPTCAAGTLSITSYPDGSPGLVDFKKANGTIATAAVFGDGAGGSSLTALDVTQTVTYTSASSNTVQGPTPLWNVSPGSPNAGTAISKPGIARTLIGGVETYVAVAGTGGTNNTKGLVVGGYNLETGALLWQFELKCALTSDITIFETDDTGEVGSPQLDGYADRAVFADQCGYVYKINPGQNLAGGYMDNTGYGTISIGASNGKNRFALFSTATTAGAVGGQRPIANTIGARTDSTLNVVLFFGTGGLQSFDPTKVNEFYAVYAKNGTIRNKITGTCTAGECQKYYGGVVVTPTNIYMVTSSDPVISSSTCNLGSSSLNAFDLNTLTSTFSVSSINGNPISASAGPLFGADGALYFATVAGNVERVGTPTAATAGAASAAGTLNGMGSAQVTDANGPFTLVGWRVVL